MQGKLKAPACFFMETEEAKILVSSCLLGKKCSYDGEGRLSRGVKRLCRKWGCVDICPEIAGGLGSPRDRHELLSSGGRMKVVSLSGEDHTEYFIRGSLEALRVAKERGVKIAVLKARSPSCGKGLIYSGDFSGSLTEGNGLTAEVLMKNNIKVFTEEELKEAERALEER